MFIDLGWGIFECMRDKKREAREDCTSRSFIIFTLHQKPLGILSQGKWNGRIIWHTNERYEMHRAWI